MKKGIKIFVEIPFFVIIYGMEHEYEKQDKNTTFIHGKNLGRDCHAVRNPQKSDRHYITYTAFFEGNP